MTRTTVRSEDITAGQVKSADLASDAVDTAELADDAVTVAKMNDSAYLANRNMIINGAMQIHQRGTTAAGSATNI
ncbi:MAG: hypothetical protein QF704_17630, partial [Anaerolineales bacterium]|nr:hypothetical protein [Anaerolineales bacterium]